MRNVIALASYCDDATGSLISKRPKCILGALALTLLLLHSLPRLPLDGLQTAKADDERCRRRSWPVPITFVASSASLSRSAQTPGSSNDRRLILSLNDTDAYDRLKIEDES